MIKNDVFGQKIYSKLAKNYTFLNYDNSPLNEENVKGLTSSASINNENANISNSAHGSNVNKKSRKDASNHSDAHGGNYSNSNDGNMNYNQNQRNYKNYGHYNYGNDNQRNQVRQQNNINNSDYEYMYNGYPVISDPTMSRNDFIQTNNFFIIILFYMALSFIFINLNYF